MKYLVRLDNGLVGTYETTLVPLTPPRIGEEVIIDTHDDDGDVIKKSGRIAEIIDEKP